MNILSRLIYQFKRNKFSLNLIGYYIKRTLPIVYYPFVKIRQPKKIIFFIGNQGDGMSFVTRVIRKNPCIVSITGNNNYWSGADEMATVMEAVLPYSLRLPGLVTKERIKSELQPPRSWSYGSDKFLDHYISSEVDYNKKDCNRFLKTISTALYRFGDDKILVDKSQIYSLKIRLLKKIFKKRVYFVHITRNPLISCYRASNGKAGDLKRYAKNLKFNQLIDISTQHWNNVSQEISKSVDEETNYIRFKIEDILKNPELNFKKICHFIGIQFNENMLPNSKDKIPLFSKFQDRWYPIRQDINQSYLKSMDNETKKIIINKLKLKLVLEQGYKL